MEEKSKWTVWGLEKMEKGREEKKRKWKKKKKERDSK